MLTFRPLSDPPQSFTPCLVKRSLEKHIKINGVIQHGLTERRSEFIVAFYSGSHWLGRESHWHEWATIPSESSKDWKNASLFIPETSQPVLTILPQPVIFRNLIIPSGLHFACFDNREDRTWRVYQRNQGARITENDELEFTRCWVPVGLKKISSWLKLPPLNKKLRAVDESI